MKNLLSKKELKKLVFVIFGSFLLALNIQSFIGAGGLFPGGFTGLTVLIQRSFLKFADVKIPYALVLYSLNAIPAYIGYKTVGKKFTVYSILVIILSGAFVEIIPEIRITEDLLLISVFGGILQGFALGVTLRGDASSGGTDFISMWISTKTNQPAWNLIFAMNTTMLAVAGILFGWEAALYSIIFQFCSTQIVNAVYIRYQRRTIFIVTRRPEIIIEEIQTSTHHGVTRIEGIGTYYGEPRTFLYTVVGCENVKELVTRIHELDPSSFINVTTSEAIEGRFYQRPIE